jgi:hypothetical protein
VIAADHHQEITVGRTSKPDTQELAAPQHIGSARTNRMLDDVCERVSLSHPT